MFNKLYGKLFPKQYESSPAYRREAAAKWNNLLLKYVTEREETGDRVIAKDGYICVAGGFVFVNTETASVFKCEDDKVDCGELMSHDGVILTGHDIITDRDRSIICYFKYYR